MDHLDNAEFVTNFDFSIRSSLSPIFQQRLRCDRQQLHPDRLL